MFNFRCSKCNQCLSNWYFEKNGKLFCKQDYWSAFGEACNGCTEIITGPVMVIIDLFFSMAVAITLDSLKSAYAIFFCENYQS